MSKYCSSQVTGKETEAQRGGIMSQSQVVNLAPFNFLVVTKFDSGKTADFPVFCLHFLSYKLRGLDYISSSQTAGLLKTLIARPPVEFLVQKMWSGAFPTSLQPYFETH